MDHVTPARKWTVVEAAEEDVPFSSPVRHMAALPTVVMFFTVVGPIAGLVFAICMLWHRASNHSSWGIGWPEVIMMVAMYSLTGFGVTIGYHRLLTHKAFETFKPVKWLLSIFASAGGQGMCIRWVAVHRRHHQQADLDGDPHSPHLHGDTVLGFLRGLLHAHIGWAFEKDKPDLARSVPDLMNDPVLVWIDQLYLLWVAVGILLPGLILGLCYHSWSSFLSGIIWGGLVRICLQQHVTWSINSVCHVWGTRRFANRDYSTNNFPIAIVSLGEGWHNNHHAFPTSARHGLRWWEFDASWVVISVMKLTGLAWNVRVPSAAAMQAREHKEVGVAVQ